SASLNGPGTSSSPWKMASWGMSWKRSSIFSKPRLVSISRLSSSVMGIYRTWLDPLQILGVLLFVHEIANLSRIVQLDLRDPAFIQGRFIDQFRAVFQSFVHSHDPAAHRSIHVGNSLHRLQNSKAFAFFHNVTHGRQVHENDVAQLVLGVIADTDPDNAALYQNPLVLLGIQQFLTHDETSSLFSLSSPAS